MQLRVPHDLVNGLADFPLSGSCNRLKAGTDPSQHNPTHNFRYGPQDMDDVLVKAPLIAALWSLCENSTLVPNPLVPDPTALP
jgi:hypothetical protein